MLRDSTRLRRVDQPIIPTIAALVRANPGTVSLGQGVVNYGPPAQAIEAVARMTENPANHKYQAVGGIPDLVDALWEKVRVENGIAYDGNGLMVTAGSNMAFLNAVLAVADPGDEIILPLPYYFNQEMAIRMANCVPVTVPTRPDFQLDVGRLAAAITPRTRAIVTVSPNNPSGAVYSREDLSDVSRLCARHGIYHFSDEAYEWFVHEDARHFSPASLPGAAAHTLSFFSFSKNYGMASWRVGYVVYPSTLHDALNKVQDTNVICAPVASQHVALTALRSGREAVASHLGGLSSVRTQVFDALGELGALASFPRTRGAFYVLVRLPGVDLPMAFNEAMVRDHRVATVPGFAFGLSDTREANWQRLSYGALDAGTVQEGVRRFVRAVRDWYGHG